MPRHLILGTAGHIDHGKTSLVKALTGVVTDRLPEEKARGITIDIGFAELDLGDIRVGIVDVPGHERFIHNMLAGATGIDLALLVVAADDSVMPQTREHFEILKLLGVKEGVIALTKTDLVDETTCEVAELEIRELVQGSFLEAAPIIRTASPVRIGFEELKAAVMAACSSIDRDSFDEPFRLPIDRAFVLQGHGTIVTGSVVAGRVRAGDTLEWHRGDGTSETVRVRSLNNHGRAVDELLRGQRGGINLAGVDHEHVRRGQELATPGLLRPSRVLTVSVTPIAGAIRPLRHRLPARLHLGTAEVMATISLLDAESTPALAQLFLAEPVTALHGQHYVLRDSSGEHTLAGGSVLQPNPCKLRRRQEVALTQARQLLSPDAAERTLAAAWLAGLDGFATGDSARLASVQVQHCMRLETQLRQAGAIVELRKDDAGLPVFFHREIIAELEEQILTALATLHASEPLLTNHDRAKLHSLFPHVNDAIWARIIDSMLARHRLTGDLRRIARADFKPKLSVNQRKLKDRIVADHAAAGFAPPEPASYANLTGGSTRGLVEIYDVAVAEGHLVKVNAEIYLHADVAKGMIEKVRALLAKGGATVADIRNELGTTRKYAVPICEYLDRAGITRREGDLRVLV